MLLPLFHSWHLPMDNRLCRHAYSCERALLEHQPRAGDCWDQVLGQGAWPRQDNTSWLLSCGEGWNRRPREGVAAVTGSFCSTWLASYTQKSSTSFSLTTASWEQAASGVLHHYQFSSGRQECSIFLLVYASLLLSMCFFQTPLLTPSRRGKPSLEGADWRNRLEGGITTNSRRQTQRRRRTKKRWRREG